LANDVGAGTGSSTEAVFNALDGAYSSYTYTDISSGFFEKAAARFASQADKIVFKTMDIEKLPANQGYNPNSYDVRPPPNSISSKLTGTR